MSALEYSEADKKIEEKQHTNRRRNMKHYDRLKAERAKDYSRFPVKPIRHPVPEELQIDLSRVKKISDIDSLE